MLKTVNEHSFEWGAQWTLLASLNLITRAVITINVTISIYDELVAAI